MRRTAPLAHRAALLAGLVRRTAPLAHQAALLAGLVRRIAPLAHRAALLTGLVRRTAPLAPGLPSQNDPQPDSRHVAYLAADFSRKWR